MVSLLVIAVAGVSLLLLSIEQIVERRRPLPALAANGVPPSVRLRGSPGRTGVPVLTRPLIRQATRLESLRAE